MYVLVLGLVSDVKDYGSIRLEHSLWLLNDEVASKVVIGKIDKEEKKSENLYYFTNMPVPVFGIRKFERKEEMKIIGEKYEARKVRFRTLTEEKVLRSADDYRLFSIDYSNFIENYRKLLINTGRFSQNEIEKFLF